MIKILIVGSTHGHEKIGQYVIHELRKKVPKLISLEYIIGNPKAAEKNIPFVESDLNRVFPGNPRGTYEERLANQLRKKIMEVDLVIDIHSTKTTDYSSNSMLIITKLDQQTRMLIEIINPPKVLLMKYKNTNALISEAKIGIAFEYGRDNSKKVLNATLHDIGNLLVHNTLLKQNPFKFKKNIIKTQYFEVYDVCKKEFEGSFKIKKDFENFKLLKKGQIIGKKEDGELLLADEDFYPIMFGKNRYTTILGFKARKYKK